MSSATDLTLTVNGSAYQGWKRISVTRGIESLAGGFDLGITPGAVFKNGPPVPAIYEEQPCTVTMLGQTVITGYVDKRTMGLEPSSRTFGVSGRDKAAALVDCSAVLPKLVYKNVPLLDIATAICQPFGITVALQQGLQLKVPPWDKLAVNVGDKAAAALEKACRITGVLPVSDGMGGMMLVRAGSARAVTGLVSGVNVIRATATYDWSQRYYRYLCLSAHAGKVPKKVVTKAAGKQLAKANAAFGRARGEAFDEEVTRKERVLLINPEDGATKEYAQARAEWEAKVRAGKAETVTVTVQGWEQEDGSLWPINALCPVDIDEIGVGGTPPGVSAPGASLTADMLITQAKYGVSESGTITELTLRRPDAYTPEPRIKRATGGKGGFKLIAQGVTL